MKNAATLYPGIRTLVVAAVALSCSIALAGELKQAVSPGPLPGVDPARAVPDYRQPAPEPNDPAAIEPETRDGYTRIGNWDVRVSGSVSYEMGFGSGPRPR